MRVSELQQGAGSTCGSSCCRCFVFLAAPPPMLLLSGMSSNFRWMLDAVVSHCGAVGGAAVFREFSVFPTQAAGGQSASDRHGHRDLRWDWPFPGSPPGVPTYSRGGPRGRSSREHVPHQHGDTSRVGASGGALPGAVASRLGSLCPALTWAQPWRTGTGHIFTPAQCGRLSPCWRLSPTAMAPACPFQPLASS